MNRYWCRWWLTLTLLVSGALPVPFLNAGQPQGRVTNAPVFSLFEPGARPAEFRLSELVAFLRASNQAKDPDGHGPIFKKGARRDGDGAPPKDLQAWVAPGLTGLDVHAEADDATLPPSGPPGVFALQGMQPEQGGQTGPPKEIASLS